MATKKMRSYRIDESTDQLIKAAASRLDVSEADLIKTAVNWLYDSSAIYGLDNVKREGMCVGFDPMRVLTNAVESGEVGSVVKGNIWVNCNGFRR